MYLSLIYFFGCFLLQWRHCDINLLLMVTSACAAEPGTYRTHLNKRLFFAELIKIKMCSEQVEVCKKIIQISWDVLKMEAIRRSGVIFEPPCMQYGLICIVYCTRCHPSCMTCFGPGELDCLTCFHPLKLTGTTCLESCLPGNYLLWTNDNS